MLVPPISHPKCWSFFGRLVVGYHPFRKPPNMSSFAAFYWHPRDWGGDSETDEIPLRGAASWIRTQGGGGFQWGRQCCFLGREVTILVRLVGCCCFSFPQVLEGWWNVLFFCEIVWKCGFLRRRARGVYHFVVLPFVSYCWWFRNFSWYGKYPIINRVLAPSNRWLAMGFLIHQQ